MNEGWIKFHRNFKTWEWRDDPNMVALFMNLLVEVNYEPSKYRGSDVLAGSGIFGREKLSKITGLSVQQVRTCLNKLKSTREITIKITNKFSIISITNWEKYQADNQQLNQQVTINQPTDNQQVTTSKEGKKERKKEKEEKSTPRSELEKILDAEHAVAVIEHRQRLRKPMTSRAANLLAQKLAECPDANAAADTMIERGWQSINPDWLKDKPSRQSSEDRDYENMKALL